MSTENLFTVKNLQEIFTHDWFVSFFAFLITIIVLSFALKVISRLVVTWLKSSQKTWSDAVLEELRRPVQTLILILSLYISLRIGLRMGGESIAWVNSGFKFLVILCVTWITERVIVLLIQGNAGKLKMSAATRDLCLIFTRIALLSLGILVTLDSLGISVTPILASLGVGSIAVALALQDTLTNFFSGVYILMDQPIRLGDFIKLETGIEGYVRKIGWRSTQIQLTANNVVVIPNSKLASSLITNFDLPDEETAVIIKLSVAYASDLSLVEKVALETAQKVQASCQEAVPSFQPVVRFSHLNESGIDFTVVLRTIHYTDAAEVTHQFIKTIIPAFRSAGIEIPYPQRVVNIVQKENKVV